MKKKQWIMACTVLLWMMIAAVLSAQQGQEAEQKPKVLTDGGSVVINGVTISYSDGLITMVNNSGKVARVMYKYDDPIEVSSETTITGTTGGTTTTTTTTNASTEGGKILRVGATSETLLSRENPPKEIVILEVTLREP